MQVKKKREEKLEEMRNIGKNRKNQLKEIIFKGKMRTKKDTEIKRGRK